MPSYPIAEEPSFAAGSSSHDDDDDMDSLYTTSRDFDGEDPRQSDAKGAITKLTTKETRQIWVWKTVVILIIIVTAALVSAGAYIFLDRDEDQNYQDNYAQVVNTIRDSAEFHASNIYVTLRSFAHTVTVEAEALGQKFPFVTIQSFEAIGSAVRSTTGAELINWHVIVEENELEQWANYTLSNYQEMLARSRATALRLQAEGSSIKPSDFIEADIAPLPYKVPSATGDPNAPGGIKLAPDYGPGPYWPAWMTSPPIFDPRFINVDPAPDALHMPIKAVVEARRLVFTDTVPVQNLADFSLNADDHEKYHESLVDYVNTDSGTAFLHPHSAVMVPIFEQVNDPSSRMVGTMVVIFPWDRYLVNLLPSGVTGITCVLRNSCGKSWTYELSGNSAFYKGEGDFHDPAFDSTEAILPFQDPNNNITESVPGECNYAYHIYATRDFEDQYRSNLPWALTLVVALTFVGMIGTFLVYDLSVKKRNQKVVGHATRTNAIVDSLFPKEAKNRLLEEQEQKQQLAKQQLAKSNDPYKGFLDTHQEGVCDEECRKSDPIANLHPECTVYFADIAGFTQWSSTREPVDVFRLLEAIYSEFDRIAKRRFVFKVETIGDCYVAITGVPQPQKDHAVKMAKFAWDTREKMRVVTQSLEASLGADTRNLELRIGLHSGAVTAGVLRGEKSRFQLFGDTVNTAARMESNGERGKIQVSEATAERLRQAGKGSWLTARTDLVEAKGKGSMQTYWVELSRRAGTNTNSTSAWDMSESAPHWTTPLPPKTEEEDDDDFHDEPRAESAPAMQFTLELEV